MTDYSTLFTDKHLGQFFEDEVNAHPDRDFIVYPDRELRWTYGAFNERVDALAGGLLEIGIGKGDHVGIWARNVPDWLTFTFATAKIGAVLITVNTLYKKHEIDYVLKQSNMKALALLDRYQDSNYIDIIYELIPELRECTRGHLNSEEYPALKSLIYIGQQKHRGMYNTHELILLGQHCDDQRLRDILPTLHCDEVVNMQYTSGTTGFPKGVMLTSRNIVNNGYYIGERQKFTGEDRLCLPVPLFHCFGIVLGVMATLTHGGTLVPLEVFDPVYALEAVEKERCTAIYGVPTMFIAEMNYPAFDQYDLSSLRTGIMAGSPCPIEAMKNVMTKMHCHDITIAYGLTEASPVFTQTTVDDAPEVRSNTVGQAMPHIEVKIVHPETGEVVAVDEPGEICCRGYNVMKGYYNLPEATALAIDADGWLHSGDIATVDKDGYYRITGRIKDMIIRGGENVYPREVEEFLHTLPEVLDAQVVGVPDDKYGEIVGAFVILRSGQRTTEEDLREACRNSMARYKVPKYIFFVDAYPLTASGKIQKYKLREQACELLGRTMKKI
ncbi:MAG: AMP-binding protein [Spartobacteria bacterium]|nr:AMP-binding protein [Spartobacteria bacterium]